jgi:hypothetical protein
MFKPHSKIQRRNRAYRASITASGIGLIANARTLVRAFNASTKPMTGKQRASVYRAMLKWGNRKRSWMYRSIARWWASHHSTWMYLETIPGAGFFPLRLIKSSLSR